MYRVVASTSAALATAMLPVFLLGALTEEFGRELGLSEAEVGAAATILFIVAGAAATPAGRVTERIGAAWALRIGVAIVALVTAVTAGWANGFWQLALPLSAAGIAVGLVDTGAARAYSDALTPEEQGRAFGLKEASVPTASLLAGLAVPALAAPFGWRSAFAAAVVIAASALLAVWRVGGAAAARSATATEQATSTSDELGTEASRSDTQPAAGAAQSKAGAAQPEAGAAQPEAGAAQPEAGAAQSEAGAAQPAETSTRAKKAAPIAKSTILLAAGVGVGAGAATAAAAFMVPALSARGMQSATAGFALSAASVASIAVRIGAGLWADRPGARPAVATAILCALGCAAAAALALPIGAALAIGCAALLLGAGWGWTGLAFLTAVRANPEAAAPAAGVILTGLALGGALGPVAFGVLAAEQSYAAAWIATAIALAVAALAAYATGDARRTRGESAS